MVPSMAFCNYEEIIVAKLGKFFCNFVRFYYAINTGTHKSAGFAVSEHLKFADKAMNDFPPVLDKKILFSVSIVV